MDKWPMDKVRVEYVDYLPMVNVTDSFLVTKRASQNFKNDLKEFFPFFMENYFLRKAFNVAKGGGINLFRRRQKYNTVEYIPTKTFQHIPEDMEAQKILANEYLSDASSYEELRSMLTEKGRKTFGLGNTNVFLLSSYEELLEYLVGIKERWDCYFLVPMRMLSVFLHRRNNYLWPLYKFKREIKWCHYIEEYGYPFSIFLLSQLNNSNPKRLNDLKSHGIRLFRATRWQSLKDLNDDDIDRMRNKLKELERRIGTTFSTLVELTIDNGADLTYQSYGERVSKAASKGLLDGTFLYYVKECKDKHHFNYWVQKACDYYQYRAHNERIRNLECVCVYINKWFDYLLYLNAEGHYLSSINDIKRELHIVFQSSMNHNLLSFTKWLSKKDISQGYQHLIISGVRTFFDWIIFTEGLNIRNPIEEVDVPLAGRRPYKSHRLALTTEMFATMRDILLNEPLPHYETISDNGLYVKKQSPTLQTYTLARLMLGIRHIQAAYLDKDNVIHRDGFLVSGDKNQNRELLQIIPYFDEKLKEKFKECIHWQNRYNYPVKPVWYGGSKNSPFGKVIPLFRLIGRGTKPVSRMTCDAYLKRVLLKLQKRMDLEGEKQLLFHKSGQPLDMSIIDVDKMGYLEAQKYKTKFDLHSLRVTAATIWFEAGIDIELIQEFITGHATIAMLMHYINIRKAEKVMKTAFEDIISKRGEVELELESDADRAIRKFLLRSRVIRSEDRELEGVKVIEDTPRTFWRFFHYGICPTGACPNGLDGRCSLCPILISGPPYKTAIAAQINLLSERIMVSAVEMRNSGTSNTHRQAAFESLVQEFAGWVGWYQFIEGIEQDYNHDERENNKLILYSQVKHELRYTTPTILALQRCIDIILYPEVYSEQTYYTIRGILKTVLSKIPMGKSPYEVIDGLSKKGAIEKTASYFLKLIEQGKSYEEIDAIFSDGGKLLAGCY